MAQHPPGVVTSPSSPRLQTPATPKFGSSASQRPAHFSPVTFRALVDIHNQPAYKKEERQDISQELKRMERGGREEKNEVLLNIINNSQCLSLGEMDWGGWVAVYTHN